MLTDFFHIGAGISRYFAVLLNKDNSQTEDFWSFSEGRSAGDGTFHINMVKMRQLNVNTDDSGSPTGKSMRIGTGNTWLEIYEEVEIEILKMIFKYNSSDRFSHQ